MAPHPSCSDMDSGDLILQLGCEAYCSKTVLKETKMRTKKQAIAFYRLLVYAAHKAGNGDIEAGIKALHQTWDMPEPYYHGIRERYHREGVMAKVLWFEDASACFVDNMEMAAMLDATIG